MVREDFLVQTQKITRILNNFLSPYDSHIGFEFQVSPGAILRPLCMGRFKVVPHCWITKISHRVANITHTVTTFILGGISVRPLVHERHWILNFS